MAVNILERIQENLGYPPLHKIDPNTQQEKDDKDNPNHTIGQAAIAAVVIGMYKFSRTDENAEKLQSGKNSTKWAEVLFGENADKVVESVAKYGNVTIDTASQETEKVAEEAVKIVKENVSEPITGSGIKDFFTLQRADILLYLPAELNMGEYLEDTTIDDRTNKMEGPISNLVHAIEQTFSDSGEKPKEE